MRVIWAICGTAACVVALAAIRYADFPTLVVIGAVLMMVLSWL